MDAKRKPTMNQHERRIRRRSGFIWFELLPFISNETLESWAAIKNRTRGPEEVREKDRRTAMAAIARKG